MAQWIMHPGAYPHLDGAVVLQGAILTIPEPYCAWRIGNGMYNQYLPTPPAFGCFANTACLRQLVFRGTEEQWEQVQKGFHFLEQSSLSLA